MNDELRELCEKFTLKLETTGAEASWSNGLVERHHAIIEHNNHKVMDDTKCGLDMAIPWVNCAKNSLGNVYGFSPNQLVFGRNINLPSVHHDKLQNELCKSNVIAKHLIVLHKTRQAFIAHESCEKLPTSSFEFFQILSIKQVIMCILREMTTRGGMVQLR